MKLKLVSTEDDANDSSTQVDPLDCGGDGVVEQEDPGIKHCLVSKEDLDFIRLGKAVANLDFSLIPTKKLTRKVKFGGEEILKNVQKAMEFISSSLGADVVKTPFHGVKKATAAMTGVHRNTVMYQEKKKLQPQKRPLKQLSKKERNRHAAAQLNIVQKTKLRKYIHERWANNQQVSTSLLFEWAKDNIGFKKQHTHFYHTLKGMGFTYKGLDVNTVVDERSDIIWNRKFYLGKKKNYDEENYYIASTDETWFHDGMGAKRGWQMANSSSYKRARMADMSTPMAGPRKAKTRGKRAICLATLTEDGVLPDSDLVIISGVNPENQNEDYHQDMCSDTYEKYIRKVVPLVKQAADKKNRKAALIVDNAPYHNKTLEKPPTMNGNRADIIEFLLKHNVGFDPSLLRPQLAKVMKRFIDANGGRSAFTVYEFDVWARSQGVEIIRLPQYHCYFNPIELLWGQMKQHLRNTGSIADKLETVRQKAVQFLRSFSAEAAQKIINHAKKEECEVREMMEERALTFEDVSGSGMLYEVDENGEMVPIGFDDEEEYEVEEELEEHIDSSSSEYEFDTFEPEIHDETDMV
ncbi:hypothetical protein CRE_31020 [Caenorhabditis remanei]|uniref:Uncharacterized protein n=1 Tax=Caenorhabditis remanei TaxID=31234 RepID=E3LU58_CAERE|nr:hypothetical protein CRE_31020 [Caenorhabditis remanei]